MQCMRNIPNQPKIPETSFYHDAREICFSDTKRCSLTNVSAVRIPSAFLRAVGNENKTQTQATAGTEAYVWVECNGRKRNLVT